jgi:hypothetical protein
MELINATKMQTGYTMGTRADGRELLVVDVHPFWRRKFEASTGTNCMRFYGNGAIQPLEAAATVEDFLEGAEAGKYEDRVRYFFGHRIPD